MTTVHAQFTIDSDRRPTFDDVTDRVTEIAAGCGLADGLVTVYSQHTTCAVLIQEQSDDVNYWGTQFILQDLVGGLATLFPSCATEGQYLHPGPEHIRIAQAERAEEPVWSLNTDAHLRSVMLGRSVAIPLQDGRLELGDFGRIYFADFDQVRARTRTVRVAIVG
ncbi:MAG: secondary thiamine-phosphate synthase enzyme YjbQ [Propionicimonas sp.]|uniref:secondary thiamine-phosphate synthase enzyme YjbQ n=1 Tax=Propionicimonas sp. TaxID=1955623 RepID=UPI002B21DD2B|nr:secondary thiamine-phosphate synthase enzyme YjbQ [Propionicimonas sp.]MEA4945669.1 secondary thiamine-phosphate synthase enzyme YjbQ [Propionicimonas sp.]MEA5119447.1 secondary thiamine-phosphate synthase enzyme YjbQ [Propionicimonas sp.]